MHKRLAISFLSVVCLLFFSGIISLVELSRLVRDTNEVLTANHRSLELAREMLDVAYAQNMALMRFSLSGDTTYRSDCRLSMERLESVLLTAQTEAENSSLLDSLAFTTTELHLLTNHYLTSWGREDETTSDSAAGDKIWYDAQYEALHSRLISAIKDYMTSTRSSLVPHAELMKTKAYRAVTPVLISLLVMIAILLMLYYFISIYCVTPLVRMNKSLGCYLSYRIPFTVKADFKDEALELKERIETLIAISKQAKQ